MKLIVGQKYWMTVLQNAFHCEEHNTAPHFEIIASGINLPISIPTFTSL
ncbi:MAG TPA: hypothetical protein VK249_18215 [Anaerolineales bacterium]|nr:hypothetical protein [Anaerolineales bacterium]